MKRIILIIALSLTAVFAVTSHLRQVPPPVHVAYDLREGDILFHGSGSPQCRAIREATESPYTHCGVVIDHDGRLMVLEAVQPVRLTTLEAFQARSVPGTYHARRLKAPLDPASIEVARKWGEKQVGRNYDPHFTWHDGALYCSELVWKAYDKAGIRLCEPRRFHDYKLDHPVVKEIIARRYGSADKLPRHEPVVAPSDLAASPLLEEVPRLQH